MGEWRTATDEVGEFRLSQLPPGDYTLEIQLAGYASFTLEGFAVHAGQTLRLQRAMLPLGASGIAETSRQHGVIAQESARIGGVIAREQMELIPYGRIQRSFDATAVAVPGTLPLQLTVIDGAQNARAPLLQNFLQEAGAMTGGYRAEYGRSPGGIFTAVLKSGGNDFHGSAFGSFLPSPRAWDAGAELGGPIQRDKLWFYGGVAPVDTPGQTDFQYVGKLSYRPAEDHALGLSVFTDASALRYLGRLFDQRLDVDGTVWWNRGSRPEGSLKLTNSFDLLGHHQLKIGAESWAAAFAQDTWSLFDRVVIDAGLRVEDKNTMPRVGAAWDFTGRGFAKLYAFYGRFEDTEQALAGVQYQFLGDLVASIDCTNHPHNAVIAAITKPFSQGYLLQLSYAYPHHAAKADLAYVYEWTPKTTVSLGASFHAIEASPWDTQIAGRLAVSHALTPIYTLTASADGFTNPAAARFGLRLSF